MDTVLASLSNPVRDRSEWRQMPVGKIAISIDGAGQWLYQGQPIVNPAIVVHFSSRLFMHEGDYFLASDWQKLRITVEDVPFVVVDAEISTAHGLSCRTQLNESFYLNELSDWQLRAYDGVMLPYLHVRDGLWARMGRAPYYRLVDSAKLVELNGGASIVIPCGKLELPLGTYR